MDKRVGELEKLVGSSSTTLDEVSILHLSLCHECAYNYISARQHPFLHHFYRLSQGLTCKSTFSPNHGTSTPFPGDSSCSSRISNEHHSMHDMESMATRPLRIKPPLIKTFKPYSLCSIVLPLSYLISHIFLRVSERFPHCTRVLQGLLKR